MRRLIQEFVALTADSVNLPEPIYEFGSLQVPGQEEAADLRPYFPNKKYVGADMRMGPGVDVILNLHHIDLPDGVVGTAICVETLEHVEYPFTAMSEIYRVLKPGGVAIITSQMKFPIHNYPADYWRYTPEAFRTLLKPFTACFVGWAGERDFPHTVAGVGFKDTSPDLTRLNAAYQVWQKKHNKALNQFVKLFIPPIVIKLWIATWLATHRGRTL